MKNNLKKCLALLVAMVMVLAMATSVFADEQYSLTITSQTSYDKAVTYNVYQLFKCNLDANNVPSYTKEGALNSALVGNKDVEDFSGMSESDLFAYAATVSTANVTAYNTLTTGTALTDIDAGYYLLIPTNIASTSDTDSDSMNDTGGIVSSPILIAVPKVTKKEDNTYEVTSAVTVASKDSTVSHEKKITDVESEYGTNDTISSSKDTASAGQGDTIEYTITNTVPLYKSDVDETKVNYYVVDTYDSNLTLMANTPITITAPANLTEGSLKETTATAADGTTYTVYSVENGDYAIVKDDVNHKFTVYFNYAAVKTATNVIIKAKFTQNASATPGTEIVNDSQLTYTNNYYTGTDSTLEDKVKSYTFAFNVFKYDTKDNSALSGAKFGLFTDENCTDATKIAEATSDNAGLVNFNVKLNEGTYYVKEIEAPNGYRVDTVVRTVVITDNKDTTSGEYTGTYTVKVDNVEIGTTVTVDGEEQPIYNGDGKTPVFGVANTAGTTLPGTGGIGTTIFTFGGLALVILAAALFIVYMKKQKNQA